jgi:predicted CXXCH cytochrome family protein
MSGHSEGDMTCVNCHNPHTNTIKEENVGTLCQGCHSDEGDYYTMTAHAAEGLLCTDCHLRVSDTPPGEGHAQRSHTFAVDLKTCNECHGEKMHYPSDNEVDGGLGIHEAGSEDSGLSFMTNPNTPSVELNPSPISPLNLAVLTAVIGLAFGFVGSPLFERWFHKIKGETS